MAITRDQVDPQELTSIARKALAEQEINSPNSLAKWLPSQTLDDIEYEAEAGQGGLIEAAMYRAFDAGLPIGEDETLGNMRGRIHPLGQKLPIFEENQIRLRRNSEEKLRAVIERKAKRIAIAIANQVNLKRGEAIADGFLTFEGNDQNFKVPFGRRPDFTTTAPKLFSDPTADPIEYLTGLRDLWEEENGALPSNFLTSARVRTAFYRHPRITEMAVGSNGNTNRIATEGEVDSLLSLYNLPPFTVNGGRVKVRKRDQSSEIRHLIPQDSLIVLGEPGDAAEADSSGLGSTFWGVTIEATKSNWGIEESEWPGIVTAVFDNDQVPAFMSVEGSAIATPVLINPNASLRAKVL